MALEDDISYPSIEERLANLRPSRELLDFYRKKIAQYDNEHKELLDKLDSFKLSYEEEEKQRQEISAREAEITDLQRALSDMQIYLQQERDHVLRLYAENDRLKLKELNDREKIQQLLSLTSGSSCGEVTYFHKEPPSKVVIPQHKNSTTKPDVNNNKPTKKSSTSRTIPPNENENASEVAMLKLQIGALQSQLEEQTKSSREQMTALLEDRRVRQEENELQFRRASEREHQLSETVKRLQSLLYDTTRECVEQKAAQRRVEAAWLQEKDMLMRQLENVKPVAKRSQAVETLSHSVGTLETKTSKQAHDIISLKKQLEQQQQLADMYREQALAAEESTAQAREETDACKNVFRERTEKMARRLQLMNSRYQALAERRNLETEGSKNDVRMLRQRLQELEKQLLKVTLAFAEHPGGIPLSTARERKDLVMLGEVRQTGRRSQKILNDLHALKSKIYSIENDMVKM